MSGYKYKTVPRDYQRTAFQRTANLPGYGLLFVQGLGKSKVFIDTAAYLWMQAKIDCLFIVAPNGVHRNWVSDEIPAHMPDEVQAVTKTLIWKSISAKTQKYKSKIKDVLAHQGLIVVVVAYESSRTDSFKAFAKRMFGQRKVMMVLDESHKIKSPGAKVKTTLTAMGKYAPYRRIATGTPLEEAFDIYSQLRFLDPDIWVRNGFKTFEDFKAHFGVFIEQRFGGRSFEKCVSYKNLGELSDIVKSITWRLTKEEAGLNLPPKIYTKRYAQMSPEQERVYRQVKNEGTALLLSGDTVDAEQAIVKMLRLQQIACNFVSCDIEQPIQRIDLKKNTRMNLAVDEILLDIGHPAIIFSRFTADIDELCRRLGNKAVRYDGQVNEEDRARAKKAFQSGDVQYFVASKAASTGLTLTQAETVMFYSNSFSLTDRLQSEDRAHRLGVKHSVTYIDLIMENTVDEYIVGKLINKHEVFTELLGDAIMPWI